MKQHPLQPLAHYFYLFIKDKLEHLKEEKKKSELDTKEKEIVNANKFFAENKVREKSLIEKMLTYYDFDKEFKAARHFYVLGNAKKGRKHFFNALNSIKYDLYIDRDDVNPFFHKHIKFGNINIKSDSYFFMCCYRKIMNYIASDKEGSKKLHDILQREVIFYIETTAHFSEDEKWDELEKIVKNYHNKEKHKETLDVQNITTPRAGR